MYKTNHWENKLKPIIGITAGRIFSDSQILRVCLIEKYIQAIQIAGGVPIILPPSIESEELNNLIQHLDGILITGGGDIAIEKFNGQPHPSINDIDSQRDDLEINLVNLALHHQTPLLGICRGQQIINVALHGDLYTDISSQLENAIKHDWFPNIDRDYLAHSITINKNSVLHEIVSNDEIQVNSLHHQGIKKLGQRLIPVAFAADGMIEAVEINDHPFFIGVQWHPEWLLAIPAMRNLFESFVTASKGNSRNG